MTQQEKKYLIKIKSKLFDASWQVITDNINLKFGTMYSASTVRKNWYKLKKEIGPKLETNNIISEKIYKQAVKQVQVLKEELHKEKVKTQQLLEAVRTSINRFDFKRINKPRKRKYKSTIPSEVHLLRSDRM